MKRLAKFLILGLAVLLLAGCGGTGDALSVEGELCYPGLRWGMTLEEALDALDLDESGYSVYDDYDISGNADVYAYIYKRHTISVPGQTLFAPAREVRLEFVAHTREAVPMLYDVLVIYPAGTDMDAVRAAVEEQLGPGQTSEYDEDLCWSGENREAGYMSDGYYQRRLIKRAGIGSMDVVLDLAASWLHLEIDPEGATQLNKLDEGEAALHFVTGLTEIFQTDPGHSRTPMEGRSEFYADGLIVYPGTMWSMTPEQVRSALGLDEAEILEDGEGRQVFRAEGSFCGLDAAATFTFESWFDGAPGLTAVELVFPEGRDGLMEQLQGTLGDPEGDCWSGEMPMSEFLYPQKTAWYREYTGQDPEQEPASKLTWTAEGLLLESGAALACRMNEAEEPDEYAALKALFDRELGDVWYRRALSCCYDCPEEIDLGELFYDCVIPERASGAELEALKERYDESAIFSCTTFRVTTGEMEAALERYFGVSLADCDLDTMYGWIYCEETDAWLNLGMAGSRVDPLFQEGQTLENGDIVLTYRSAQNSPVYAVTLRQNSGVWQVVSNVMAEE